MSYRYVASEMKKALLDVDPETVILIVIDGGSDWAATEAMITDMYPWISFMHCTSHQVSLIIKDCFEILELEELNSWMSDAQHWFSSHACAAMLKQLAEPGEPCRFVWPAVTRYCGVLLKMKRFRQMKDLLRRVVSSGVYKEKNFKDDPFPAKILDAEVWQLMDRVIATMGPLLLLCRLSDGQKPVISKLYGTQLYVRHHMESVAMEAGDASVERKICDSFLRRWSEMQSDIVSATYMLDPLFVDKSKDAAECTVKLWKLVRKVSHTLFHDLTHTA